MALPPYQQKGKDETVERRHLCGVGYGNSSAGEREARKKTHHPMGQREKAFGQPDQRKRQTRSQQRKKSNQETQRHNRKPHQRNNRGI